MALNQNQFAQATVQGQMDLEFTGGGVISGQVYASEATALVAGQPIKMVDSAGGVPKVTALTANTDATFAYVARNIKDQNFPAGAAVELAMNGSIMYMTSGAAIARGAKLENVYNTVKVITNAGTNPVCGVALDKATATDQLIRVLILTPVTSSQTIADIAGLQTALDARNQTVTVTCSLAELNAGKVLIAGVTGKKITVTGLTRRVTGNAAAATSVDVQSDATSVKVFVDLIAALTTGAVIINKETNCTPGAGWAVELPVNEGVEAQSVGSALTTLTSIQYTVTYRQAA
jgi:predicted RecA/RadA family phage recombinase